MGHGRASATAKNGARRGNIERISKSTRNALLSWGSQNFSNIINAQMGSGSSEDKALADELERYVTIHLTQRTFGEVSH